MDTAGEIIAVVMGEMLLSYEFENEVNNMANPELKLAASFNKDGSITTTWIRVPDGVRYQLGIHTPGNDFMWYNEQDLKGTSFTTDPNLESGKWYWIQLYVYTGTDHKLWTYSEVVKLFMPSDFYDNVPMTVPRNIKATADTVSVSISFDAVARARSYDILFDGTVYNVTTTQKKFIGLKPKTSYTYAVRAKSTNQTGAYSSTKSVMTLPLSPAIPSGIKKTVTENSATISWGAVSTATSYDLLFNGTTYSIAGTSKTFTGLTSAKSYSFQIRAKNSDASSDYTALLTVTTAPKPPTYITATSTENTIMVTWNEVEGAVGYIIRFNGNDVHTIKPSNTFTGLKSKTAYTYQICAKSADGSGSYCSVRTISTLAAAPSAPTEDSKTSTENSVMVSWGAVSGATGYDVLFNGTVYPVNGTSKMITGLSPNTSYSYQIRTKNADGVGAYGPVLTVRTTSKAPENTSGITNENSVTISWEAVPDATSYDILINGKVYNATGSSKTITGLSPNTSYSYQVRVNNENGSSSYSTAKSVKTSPSRPTIPKATASENSVTLSWDMVIGATSYDVLFNETVYRVTGTSKTFTGLTSDTSYTYSVRSNNAGGSSSYSEEQTVTTVANPPGMPANVTATATIDSVTVSWSEVSGATSYDVSLNDTAYNATGTSKTITGLTPDTSYRYAVRANNTGGSSSYTTTKTIRTQAAPPAVPTGVSAVVERNTVTVKWNGSAGASGYDVLFNGKVYNTSSSYRSKLFTGLAYNTSYSYAVRAKNSVGSSAYSSTQAVRTPIAPPAVPDNIRASATLNSVLIIWNAVSTATSYDISFGSISYRVTGTSKTITGLTPGTDYSYAVRANNAGGSGAYSSSRIIQTQTTVPAAPVNISTLATAHMITVGWDTSHMATEYDVLFDGKVWSIPDNILQINDLPANTDHTCQVRAKNKHGASKYSSEQTVRTLLETPSNIQVDADIYSMAISWDSVEGATGYDVSFNGENYYVTDPFIEILDLKAETAYDFSIRAENIVVYSEYTPVMRSFTRRAVPAVPSNVKAHATLTTVTVSWNPVHGADSYEIRFDGKKYKLSADTKMTAIRIRRKTGQHKTFWNLEPGTAHTYCIRASNESGSSDYSTLQTVFTQISNENGLPDYSLDRNYPDGRIPYMGLDPVNAMTGAFLWSYTYLQDFDRDALHFTAMYDSQRENSSSVLGEKWTYSLNYLLTMDGRYAYFTTPYHEVIPFIINKESDNFEPAGDLRTGYTMKRMEDGTYFVKSLDGTEYSFNGNLTINKIMANGIDAYRFYSDGAGRIIRIEGSYGGSLSFTYKEGHIYSVADAMGNTVAFTYHNGFLVSAASSEENSMEFTYDDHGNLLQITDFNGKTSLSNVYDDYGRVVSQNTADRGTSYASYDEENGVTVFTDELGNETTYHYDDSYHVTSIELAAGSILNEYNEKEQLVKQTNGLSNVTQMAYDEWGRMNRVTYPDGTIEQVFYNDSNYPIRLVNREGAESKYEYDVNNNLISVRDERGNECAYAYDDRNDLISYTDKSGNIWTYAYDDAHHLSQAVDPEGNSYRYSHDALGRMTSYTSPEGNTTAYHYSPEGNLLRIVDEDGIAAFEYDKNGNQTGVIDRLGNRQRLEYNNMGQVSLATDFMGNEYTFTYDEKGQLIKETDPLGYSQTYAYDSLGNQTQSTDKNGSTTVSSFNAVSQLTEVRDALGNRIKYTYDTMGQVKTVTDAMDHQTSYTYDAMGRITEVTNALGYSVSCVYDPAGNLLSKTDENGAITEYSYDLDHRPISIKTDAGITSFTYDKLGRVIAVQDTEGYSENMQYDRDGNVIAFSDKESRKTTYVYDRTGRLSEETDPAGGKTSYTYDANGNCIKITDVEGSEYLYEYDANGRMKKATDPLGYETAYEYDAVGNLKTVTDARGGRTSYEYDGNGNLIKEINPLGGEISYIYDPLNRVIEIKDKDGNKSSFTYDANGNRVSYLDANQKEWIYAYDTLNRLTDIIDQSGGRITMEYTKTGKVEKVVDQEGAETHYVYDSMGRLIEIYDALDNRLSFTYDSLGRMISQTDANGHITEFSYSPIGNIVSIKEPEGGTITYAYNALGQMTSETDALGNITVYAYDALGRTSSITDTLGGIISFTYTARGEIDTVTDACGSVTHYHYDGCGNLTQITDPMGNCISFAYDAMNNQIRECLSENGEQTCVTIYHYDKKGRMVREINPLLDERTYTYDAGGNLIAILDEDRNETVIRYDLNNRPVNLCYNDGREAAFRYNKRGELVELQDWNGTACMEYGKTGRLAKVTDHNGRITGYGYDAAGNITGITYPDHSTVSYSYDKNNRLTKATDYEGKSTHYTYDPAGNLLSLQQPGSACTYTYNAKGQPLTVQYQSDDGACMVNRFTYDASGRITGTEKTGNMPEFPKNSAYFYDALGRLTSYKEGETTDTYGYDKLGNRIFKKVNGKEEAVYQYNGLNQLISRMENGNRYSYSYDRRGNLIGEKRGGSLIKEYFYDATGHMYRTKDMESGEKTEYGYNGLNMRIKNVQTLKDRTGGYRSYKENAANSIQTMLIKETSYVTDFLSSTNNDLMVYEEGYGSVRTTFGRGYERLSQKITLEPEAFNTVKGALTSKNGGKTFFQSDLYGSPLFAANEQGSILRYAERNVWGDLKLPARDMNAPDVMAGLRFTGFCYDSVAEIQFAQARFYDAGLGRMLSKDPVKRGLNAYPYCDNDPVNYVDPTGEVANILIGGAIGGFVGGAFGFAGSAISQLTRGQRFDSKKAWGAAANGAAVGVARGALVGSGAGIALSLAANFAAGSIGSAFEQKISRGNINFKESMAGGLTNAVSGAIYGKNPLKNAKNAFWRGAGSGAATSAINYLFHMGDDQNGAQVYNASGQGERYGSYLYGNNRDSRGICGVSSQSHNVIGYSRGRGYHYQTSGTKETHKKGGFDLGDFVKEAATGFVMGGLASAAFYGVGKAVEVIRGGIQNVRANKGGSATVGRPNSGQGFSQKGYNPAPGERTLNGYVKQNANPEIPLYTDSAGFNNNGSIGGQFKRLGAEPGHGINGPHVHQPLRNVAPDGSIFGDVGSKTKNGGVTFPKPKDVKQLFEFLVNEKYR